MPVQTKLLASRLALIAGLVLAQVYFPLAAQAGPGPTALAPGVWGGEHVTLQISEVGGDAEFDCAHGQITQPIVVDGNGNFNLAGTFTAEHGGPVRRDEQTPDTPARYSGHVDGSAMSLTVKVGNETVGTYALSRGAQARLTKCR
jgi:hypothetical protein